VLNLFPRIFFAHLWPLCASALSLGSCTTHYPLSRPAVPKPALRPVVLAYPRCYRGPE